MKYARKKSRRNLLAAVIIASIILACLIGFVIFMETRETEIPTGTTAPEVTEVPSIELPTETVPVQTTVPEYTDPTPTQEAEQDLMVSTLYCNLFYPGSLKEGVRAEVTAAGLGYTVTFWGTMGEQEIALFSVLFAGEQDDGFPVGTISYEGVTMDVSVVIPDIVPESTWEPEDAEWIAARQEGVNYLLDRLESNPAFTPVFQTGNAEDPTQPTEPSSQSTEPTQAHDEPENGDLKASTPYGDLYFPGQWKDSIRWVGQETEAGYIAEFYGIVNGKESRLFTLYFAEIVDDAVPVGILTAADMTMDVSLALWDLPEDSGWSEAEQDMFYALQEKVNYLLDKLKENPGFSPIDA